MPKYKINGLSEFKRGGMAQLYRGRLNNGREVVRRDLQTQFKWNWRIRRKFITGTRVRSRIRRHPNVVWSYEVGSVGLLPFEVMDFVDGPNLQELLNENATYVRLHGLALLLQVAEALHHVHQCGFLHLDVKAGNFLISMAGEHPVARLTDFDLSVPIDKAQKTRKEYRLGTFNYMPPEQLANGQIGVKSDIFAFGVLAYNIFANRMPFRADTAVESRRRKLDETTEVPPLKQVCPDIPVRLSDMIDSCLECDPTRRCASMRRVLKELCTVTALQAISRIEKTQTMPTVG